MSGAGERALTDALTLAAVASGGGHAEGRAQVDLSGIATVSGGRLRSVG
jgi:hypothetical protein